MATIGSFSRTAILFCLVAAVSAAGGIFAFSQWQPVAADEEEPPETVTATRIETIFMPLDRQTVDVPQEAEGSGGAITEWGIPVVVTQTGEFFGIEGDTARRLDVTPPENNVEAYVAHLKSLGDTRDPLDYWFRYNAVHYTADFGGRLFLSYTDWDTDRNCLFTTIAYADVGPAPGQLGEEDWTKLYRTEPCLTISPVGPPIHGQMAAGRFVLTDDGKLVLSSGDYGKDGFNDHPAMPQMDDTDYGKIIEIDIETGDARHISKGHSNAQGIAMDREGRIWLAEHGRRGGDELNLVLEGRNYGWPRTSLGTRYNKLTLPTIDENGVHSREFEAPVFSWLPSVAPGALALIDGFDPLWDGDLLMGALMGQSLHRIRMRDGRVLFAEDIRVGHRIRDIQMLSDGRIALWTDSHSVELLSPGEADFSYELAMRFVDEVEGDDSFRAELKSTIDRCSQCHSLGQIASADGPPALGRVIGKPFSESIAEKHTGGETEWTTENLTAYLADPASFAPGNAMPDPMLERGELLEKLVLLMSVLALNPI